eukprot:TRINITY_DN10412_c0_g2_i2.p3 TRINITY_DN10412_c0_g2~~TRINITY_DN10412_c0_g2_i2.p3  ORF type:complete len:229 (-),score=83.65 TRINITY_DN10412_c0_g2_i2:103-789(-)
MESKCSRVIRKRSRNAKPPRRPMSSYMTFLRVRRPELNKEHPNAAMCEITKFAAAEWRGLTEEQKQPYFEHALVCKARYAQEMERFVQECKEEAKEMEVRRRTRAGAGAKRISGFFVYVRERRKMLKDVDGSMQNSEIVKRSAQEWGKMSAEEKEKYNEVRSMSEVKNTNKTKDANEAENANEAKSMNEVKKRREKRNKKARRKVGSGKKAEVRVTAKVVQNLLLRHN